MRCLAGSQLEAKRGFSFPAAQPHSGTSCLYTTLFIAAGEQPGATQPQSPSGSKKNNKIKKKSKKTQQQQQQQSTPVQSVCCTAPADPVACERDSEGEEKRGWAVLS